MKKNLIGTLLSTFLTTSSILSMEQLEPKQQQPLITSGMVCVSERKDDGTTAFKIFGQEDKPVFECNLPPLLYMVLSVVLGENGVLYFEGRSKDFIRTSHFQEQFGSDNNLSLWAVKGVYLGEGGTLYLVGVRKEGPLYVEGVRADGLNATFLLKSVSKKKEDNGSGGGYREVCEGYYNFYHKTEELRATSQFEFTPTPTVAPDGTFFCFGQRETSTTDGLRFTSQGPQYILSGMKSPPQSSGLDGIVNLIFSQDGTLFIHGFTGVNCFQNHQVVTVKDGEFSKPESYGFGYMKKLNLAPDNTLFILGGKTNETNLEIVPVKNGVVSWPKNYDLSDLELSDISDIVFAPNGTLFIAGKAMNDGRQYPLISVKNGIVTYIQCDEYKDFKRTVAQKESMFGFYQNLPPLHVAPNSILYYIASSGHSFSGTSLSTGEYISQDYIRPAIFTVKDGKASEPQDYGFKCIKDLTIGSDNTLFIMGEDDKDNQKNCIRRIKAGGIIEEIVYASPPPSLLQASHLSLTQITGYIPPHKRALEGLKGLLANADEKHFPMGEMDPEGLNKFALEIQKLTNSEVSHEIGKEFYDIFMSHISHFPNPDTDAAFALQNFLESLAPNLESPLYGYVLALNFEASGLQDQIFLIGNNSLNIEMEKRKLLEQKSEPTFVQRLEDTKEAKRTLEDIIEFTSPDFAKHYEHLLKRVNAALDFFDPQSAQPAG